MAFLGGRGRGRWTPLGRGREEGGGRRKGEDPAMPEVR